MATGELIQQRGNYKNLISYKKSEVIFCLTYYFVEHFLQKGDRTCDQMIQAARSGKQNIIEGCAAGITSSKTEIKLVNVAKASLQELLKMRDLGRQHSDPDFFLKIAETRPPETIANMCIVLIKQADYLLFRQLQRLAENFEKQGGFSEKMFRE